MLNPQGLYGLCMHLRTGDYGFCRFPLSYYKYISDFIHDCGGVDKKGEQWP